MKGENEKQEIKQEQENNIKITVTKEAGEILEDLVRKANEGFEAGRISRQDLASFIVERFKATLEEKDLIQLRHLHYDDAAMLQAIAKKMRETGEMPDFIRDAMRKQFQVPDEGVKRSKKSLTKKYINDVLPKHEEIV
jgi:hypothetical protein